MTESERLVLDAVEGLDWSKLEALCNKLIAELGYDLSSRRRQWYARRLRALEDNLARLRAADANREADETRRAVLEARGA